MQYNTLHYDLINLHSMTGTITKQGPRTCHFNVINRINNTRVSLFKQTFKRTRTRHSVKRYLSTYNVPDLDNTVTIRRLKSASFTNLYLKNILFSCSGTTMADKRDIVTYVDIQITKQFFVQKHQIFNFPVKC